MKRVVCWLVGLALMYSSFAVADGGAVIDEIVGTVMDEVVGDFTYELYKKTVILRQGYSINIAYPHFINEPYYGLNDMLMEAVDECVEGLRKWGETSEKIEADMECAVSFTNNKVVSVVWWGYGSVDWRNEYLIFTRNIDLNTGKNYRITDLFRVDQDFSNTFFNTCYLQSNPETSLALPFPFEEVLTSNIPKDYRVDPFKNHLLFVEFYFTPTGVAISIPTSHVEGDHFDAQISYENALKHYMLDNILWEN
jgi:hypothetical protein